MTIMNQKGEGKGSWIFGTLVFLVVVYLAFKFIPVMVRVYSFEDRVKEECKYLHGRNLEALQNDLVDAAVTEELPVDYEDITIEKIGQTLKVRIEYTVPVKTPVFVYNWHQVVKYEAPVFE